MNSPTIELANKLSDLQVKRSGISAELKTLTDRMERGEVTAGLKERAINLSRGITSLTSEIDRADSEYRIAVLESVKSGDLGTEHGDGARQDFAASFAGPAVEDARRRIDALVKSSALPDHGAERLTELLASPTPIEQSATARWTLAAGSDAWRSAFVKLAGDPHRGHLLWTPAEADAYRKVAAVQAELKAMSTTDSAGGYMIPLTLDPAIMLTSAGSINPLRRIARVVTTVTDQWQGVTSAGATAEWKAEAAEAADGSPTVAPAPIPVHFGDSYVPYSFEIGMDGINFLNELQVVLADAADQLQNTAYTTGSGTGQPKGIITALAGTASEVAPVAAESFTAPDVFAVQSALPPRFQPRAQWAANIAVINAAAQFETTNGSLKFPEIRDDRLLRKPLNELSNMDGSINPAATANNYVLLYGDFQQFVIVDRIGSQIEFIPNLVGATTGPPASAAPCSGSGPAATLWCPTPSGCST